MNDNDNWEQCPSCGGSGVMAHAAVQVRDGVQHIWMQCVWCGGSGAVSPDFAEYYISQKEEKIHKEQVFQQAIIEGVIAHSYTNPLNN